MSEILYTSVVWTAGDFITEAKMDNMVANDRAVDAMANGVQMTERADPDTPPANTVHIYVKDKEGIPTLYAINDSAEIYELAGNTPVFTFPIAGALVTGSSLTPLLIVPKTLEIVKAYAAVKVAPTGTSIIVDINKNGTSIWADTPADRLQIGAGSNSGSETDFDTITLVEGDTLSVDLDQIGSVVAGSDLTIGLKTK